MKGQDSTTPNGGSGNLPLWRKQFPIDTAQDTSRTRREFISGLAVAGGVMACGQAALNSLVPTTDANADFQSHAPLLLEKKLPDLRDGEALLFHYPNHRSPCLLVKFAENDFVAFSQKCTHLACPVIPEVAANQFQCPCHHGVFDIRSGAPLAGPPRTALPRVQVEVAKDGALTAIGVEA
jgi:nitrite reductase/ring-hydroxylating ferredoxin subunit